MGLRDRMTPKVVGTGEGLEAAAPVAGQRFDYRAETLRSKLIGDRMEGGEVERLLNQRAGEGWQLKSVTETEVKGRIGPGGTMGLLLIFERPVGGS